MKENCTYDNRWQKTAKGCVAKIYAKQRTSSKKRGHPMPEYDLEELRTWMFAQDEFWKIHREWVVSGYLKGKAPSIDRIDNDIHYTIDNIRVMTWEENDRLGNISTAKRLGKAIWGTHKKTGNRTKFISIHAAARKVNGSASNIHLALNNKGKSAYGYLWEYARKPDEEV